MLEPIAPLLWLEGLSWLVTAMVEEVLWQHLFENPLSLGDPKRTSAQQEEQTWKLIAQEPPQDVLGGARSEDPIKKKGRLARWDMSFSEKI